MKWIGPGWRFCVHTVNHISFKAVWKKVEYATNIFAVIVSVIGFISFEGNLHTLFRLKVPVSLLKKTVLLPKTSFR